MVLEGRCLTLRIMWQGWFFQNLRRILPVPLSWLLLLACDPLPSLARTCIIPASIVTWLAGFRAHSPPMSPHFDFITSAKTLFPEKVPFTGVRVKSSTYLSKGTPFNPL
jgi:hypothetical protein